MEATCCGMRISKEQRRFAPKRDGTRPQEVDFGRVYWAVKLNVNLKPKLLFPRGSTVKYFKKRGSIVAHDARARFGDGAKQAPQSSAAGKSNFARAVLSQPATSHRRLLSYFPRRTVLPSAMPPNLSSYACPQRRGCAGWT